MNPMRNFTAPLLALFIATACMVGCSAGRQAVEATPEPSPRDRAVELYDAARYEEARALITELDAEGRADGPMLYRLYYCLRTAEDAGARAMLDRAREALESSVADARNLEVAFYLANAYRNMARLSDMKKVASDATARVESGDLERPESAVERFWLGKLYSDAGDEKQASEWYARALDAFETGGSGPSAYVAWAARGLAETAYDAANYADAQRYYTMLAEASDVSVRDLDRLAMARVRLAMFDEAADAWRKAERLDPANANRPRYCSRLAGMAETLGELPSTAADGRAWSELGKADLEAILAEKVAFVAEAKQQVTEGMAKEEEQRAALERGLEEARGLFVAAALEYALQGHSIREAAFFGGYAPLIFRPAEWQLPPNPSS